MARRRIVEVSASNLILRHHAQGGSKILLVLEGDGATNAGLFSVPGGRCQEGEPPYKCAVREAWEEAGVKVNIVYTFCDLPLAEINGRCLRGHVYVSEIAGGKPRAGEGIRALRWATLEEIVWLEKEGRMISGNLLKAIKDFLEQQEA